ncbi:MAG TPA: two-component regulator propeller domain-containing protein [Acidobacteriaceae bacterium]
MKAALALITINALTCLLASPAGAIADAKPPQISREIAPIRLRVIEGKDIRFTRFSMEQGLSESRVEFMLQDHQGFMWFGTFNGLNRYDGYRFKSYKPEPNNSNSIGGVRIYSLFQDRSGALWIGVEQELDRFDPVKQTFTHFHSNPNDPASPSGYVEHITQDSDGMLWLATRNGLDRLDPDTGRFTHYRHDPNDPQSLSSSDVRFVLEDRQGTLWVATGAGPDAFDRRTGKIIRHYPISRYPPLNRMLEDRSGTLWLSSDRDGGITSLDRKTGVFTTYAYFDEWPATPGVHGCSAILEDRHGMLWLATRPEGLIKFDRQRRQFTRYRNDPSNPASLSRSSAVSLVEDREGGIWVGTDSGGVNRFSSEPSPFTTFREEPGNPKSLQGTNFILSVFEDSQGILWVATRLLNRLDRKTGRFTVYRHDPADSASITADIVFGTVEDRAGFLWFSTWGGGLNRFDRRTGRFRAYRHDPANPASLSDDFVWSLLLDHDGNVWAGTEDGLNRLDMRTGRFTVFRFDGPPESRVYRALAEDMDGSIWMGTFEQGLQHLDVRTGKIVAYKYDPNDSRSLSNNRVNAITVDHSGTLWVGTQNGLDRLDRKTGEFAIFNEREGLPNNAVEGILEDSAGNLWLSTGNGLSKFDPRARTFKHYHAEDGLAGDEFNSCSGCSFKSSAGEMFVGGVDGLTAFYPDRVVDNPYVPPIVLTDFRLFNDPVWPGKGSVLQKSIAYTDVLTLAHEQNIFSFEFSSLSYVAPQRNRYRYILEGLEKTWNEVGSGQRFVTYTTLPQGRYTFRVQGSSSSGVWNVNGANVVITILPPWWQTPWFRLLSVAAFLALLWATYQLRVRQLHHEFEMTVEARVGERVRIARDLHDTLLQSFHGVLLRLETVSFLLRERPMEAQETLDSTIEQVAEAITEGRDAVQGLRDSTVQGNDLPLAISTLGEELAVGPSKHRSGFRVAVEGEARDLHPILRDEIYKIAAEALRNAFRHAQAKQVEVEIRYDDEQFRLRVRDDGRGIDPAVLSGQGSEGHYGLRGMRERATVMGGKLVVWSEVNAGTELELRVPASTAYATARRRSWFSRRFAGKASA